MRKMITAAILLLATGCSPATRTSFAVFQVSRTVSVVTHVNQSESSGAVTTGTQDGTQAADKQYEDVASGNAVDVAPGL